MSSNGSFYSLILETISVLVRNLWNVLSSQTIGAERKNMVSGQEWQLPGAVKSLTVEEQKAVNVLVYDHESSFSENGQA